MEYRQKSFINSTFYEFLIHLFLNSLLDDPPALKVDLRRVFYRKIKKVEIGLPMYSNLPIGIFLGAMVRSFLVQLVSCFFLKYAELILSGKGTETVIALWNFLLLGSMVTIGLTEPP